MDAGFGVEACASRCPHPFFLPFSNALFTPGPGFRRARFFRGSKKNEIIFKKSLPDQHGAWFYLSILCDPIPRTPRLRCPKIALSPSPDFAAGSSEFHSVPARIFRLF